MKKLFIIGLVLILVLILIPAGIFLFLMFGGGAASQADVRYIFQTAGIQISNVHCVQVGTLRMIKCRFTVNPDEFTANISRLKFEKQSKGSPGSQYYCGTGNITPKDFEVYSAQWRHGNDSLHGVGLTTYSSSSMTFYPSTGQVCIYLDISYG
jgi:hypothetical protein